MALGGEARSDAYVHATSVREDVGRFVSTLRRALLGLSREGLRIEAPLSRIDFFLAALVYAVAFFLFAATATSVVSGEDCGELMAAVAASEPGVPHPPGYPLWAMLARGMVVFFPIGTAVQKVAWLSGIFGALAAALAFLLARRWMSGSVGRAAACGLAITLAASRTLWSQATIPEVYTLNLAFLFAVLLTLRLWVETGTRGWLLFSVALFGLSLTNHPTMAALGPIFALYAVLARPEIFGRWKLVITSAAIVVLAQLPYLYLLWASNQQPYIDWGHPATLERLVDHALRRQYSAATPDPEVLERSLHGYLERGGIFAAHAWDQCAGLVWPLALIGALVLWRRHRLELFASFAIAGACSVGIIYLTNFRLVFEHLHANSIFFLPTFALATLWAAVGLAYAIERLATFAAHRVWFPARVPWMLSAGFALLLASVTIAANYARNDRSGSEWVDRFGHAMLASLEPNAVLLPSGDHHTFPLLHLIAVELHRPDVLIADKYGYIDPPVMETMPAEFWAARERVPKDVRRAFDERAVVQRYLAEGRPVYVTTNRDPNAFPGHRLHPVGLVFRVVAIGDEATRIACAERSADVWRDLGGIDVLALPAPEIDPTSTFVAADLDYMAGWHELAYGEKDAALETWARLARWPHVSRELWNNIGSALAEAGDTPRAAAYFERALALDPRYGLARKNLAVTLYNQERWTEARALLERVLAEEADDARLLLLLGDAHRALGEPENALNTYSAAAVLMQGDVEPFLRAARLHLRDLGETEDAEELLRHAERLDPERSETLALLDEVARAKKNQDATSVASTGDASAAVPALLAPRVSLPEPVQPDPFGRMAKKEPGLVLSVPLRERLP